MRKKFVTVALLGTLIFTSTNFVGCTDYDDDINKLQEQVDALKSISISDLASQLQSLKDANSNLTTANAKMEAAIAEIKANIEALKEADKTLTSLVNGKVDQATYQAAINALNDKCSDLSSKVAALAALETAVNDLKANKADSSTVEELKKAVEKLQAVDSDFATRIGKLENTIENMNAVLAGKADQTTVDALAKSIEELKTSVAGIDTKIANALAPIQASVAKLQEDLAKKADAATIAADIAEMEKELSGLIDGVKFQHADELKQLKGDLADKIAVLEEAKNGMNAQISGLNATIDALKERIIKLETQPTTDLTEVKAAIQANKDAITKAQEAAGILQGTIDAVADRLNGLGTEAGAVKKYIDDAIEDLDNALTNKVNNLTTTVKNLETAYKLADKGLDARIEALEDLNASKLSIKELSDKQAELDDALNNEKTGLLKQLADLKSKVNGLIDEALTEGTGAISQAIAIQIDAALTTGETLTNAVNVAMSAVTGRLDNVEADLDAVLKRIQSIVFVPQFHDAAVGGVIVPVYSINGKNGMVNMKFRVSPANKAKELANSFIAKPDIFSFYAEEKLQSRAEEEAAFIIESVVGSDDGIINITAKTTLEGDNVYYPVALKLSTATDKDKSVNDITTDYFNVRVSQIQISTLKLESLKNGYGVSNKVLAIDYTQTEEFNFSNDLTLNYNSLQLESCGFEPALKLSEVWDEANNEWLTWEKDQAKIKNIDVIKNNVFTLTESGIKLTESNVSFRGKELKLKLVDESIFGTKTFELTCRVNREAQITPVDYQTITTGMLLKDENPKDNFIWTVSDAGQPIKYVISADMKNKFANTVTGATSAEVCAAIKNASITHKVKLFGSITIPADARSYPTFVVDVDNDKLTINVPAGVEYKSYEMITVYNTTYGSIELMATLNLSYPGNDILLNHDVTQWEEGAFVLTAKKATDESALYTIVDNLSKAYGSATGVSHEFKLVKINKKGEYEETSVDNVSISGNIITITDKVDLTDFWVKSTAIVENHPTNRVEYFHVQTTFPILTNKLTVTRAGDDKDKGTKFAYTPGSTAIDLGTTLSLKDRFENELVESGSVKDYAKNVYGMEAALNYNIKSAVVDGGTVATDRFEIIDGKFATITGYESTKAATVTVEVIVKHKFGPSSSVTLTVEVAKTK